jgi:hypothetical protein
MSAPRTCSHCRHWGTPSDCIGHQLAPCETQTIRGSAGEVLAQRLTAPIASCAEWTEKPAATWDDTTEPGGSN